MVGRYTWLLQRFIVVQTSSPFFFPPLRVPGGCLRAFCRTVQAACSFSSRRRRGALPMVARAASKNGCAFLARHYRVYYEYLYKHFISLPSLVLFVVLKIIKNWFVQTNYFYVYTYIRHNYLYKCINYTYATASSLRSSCVKKKNLSDAFVA